MMYARQTIFVFIMALFLMATGCGLKSARKSLSDLAIGDNKSLALERWGKPDNVQPFSGPWGERELWTYNCTQISDCDTNCLFVTPCYYLYFENDSLISVYDAVIF